MITSCGDSHSGTDGGSTGIRDSGHDSGHVVHDSGQVVQDSGHSVSDADIVPDSGDVAHDAGPRSLFADIQYATRCGETLGCPGASEHDICGFHGGDPCVASAPSPVVDCSVVETATTRTIDFEASQGGGFSVRVTDLEVAFAGGSATGGACRVRVVEGANAYAGACGSLPPSAAQPCQITNVTFRNGMGDAELEGDLFCQFLPNEALPALRIEVTAIGAGPSAAARPASFRLANCPGLTL